MYAELQSFKSSNWGRELVKTDIKTLELFKILKRNVGYFLYILAKIKGDIKNAPQRALVNFLTIKINCL